jgi:hypothetical protein
MQFNVVCARGILMASIAVLVTACGGGGSSPSSGQQVTPPPPTGSTPAPTNSAPTISGTPPTSAQVGQAYSFTPTAADADGDTLTFSVANKPAWLTLNTATGALSGTPTSTGTFANIAVTVSDGKASAALTGFSLTVNQSGTTASVTLNWAAPTANSDGSTLTNLAGYRILYGRSASNLDQSLSITNPSVNSSVVDNLATGTWYFAIVSVNAAGAESVPTNVASASI